MKNSEARKNKVHSNNKKLANKVPDNEQLQKLNERLNSILEATNTSTWEWNVETGQTIFNEQWASMLGYCLGEIKPTTIDTWFSFCHPDDLKRAEIQLGHHFNKKTDQYEAEFRMKHKDGSWVWVYDRGKVTEWTADGKPFWMLGTHQNITERKQTQIKLEKANRLYAVVSQVNQAIVHNHDRQHLFDEICKVAIAHGKFSMAWIGLIDNETGIVKPCSFAGHEDLYLSNIPNIKVVDGKGGKGPLGTAIRENRHVVCNNIESDPNMALWKDEALKRDYRSLISLPLKLYGNVIGGLSIYSNQVDFFNNDEIQLLNEVASDICYAIDTIENEIEHQKSQKARKISETRFSMLAKSAPVGIVITDQQQNTLFVSDMFIELFGYTLAEIANTEEWWKVAYPDPSYREQTFNKWKILIEQSQTSQNEIEPLEIIVRCKNGSNKDVECRLAAGDELFFITFTDISTRKKAEHKANERLKELNVFYKLSTLIEKKGITIEELFTEFVQILPLSWQHSEYAYANISINGNEYVSSNYNGRTPWVMSSPIEINGVKVGQVEVGYLQQMPNEFEGPFLCEERLMIDGITERLSRVTERKQALFSLLNTQTFNDAIIENLPGLFYLFSYPEMKLEKGNKNHEMIFGTSAKDLLKRAIPERLLPGEKTKFIKTMHRVAKDGFGQIETSLLKNDGTLMHYMLTGVRFENDNQIFIMVFGVDISEQKFALKKLIESEDKYRNLFSQMQFGMALHEIIVDEQNKPIDYRFIDVNPSFERNTGFKRDQLIGKTVLQVMPKTEKIWIEKYGEVALRGKAISFENYSNGLKRYYSVLAYQPQAMQFAVITEDITDQKNAQKSLEDNNQKFQQLSQSATEMLALETTEDIYRYLVNSLHQQYPKTVILFTEINNEKTKSKLTAVKGVSKKIIEQSIAIGKFNFFDKEFSLEPFLIPIYEKRKLHEFEGGLSNFVSSKFPTIAARAIEKLVGVRQIYTIGINKDDKLLGAIHFFNRSAEPIADFDYIETYISQAGVIIEQKRTAEELEKSEEMYRLITENASDVIWVLNITQQRFTYISPTVEQLRGYTVDEAMAQTLDESLSPESAIRVKQATERNLKKFLSNTIDTDYFIDEIQQPCKDGHLVWVEVSTTFRFNKNEEIEVVGVSRNIEDRKKMMAKIEANQNQLKEANATKDKFLSIISHDLRSPFASIVGFTDLMADENSRYSIEEYQQYSRALNRTAQSAFSLLENLLEWSRMQRGLLSFEPELINLKTQFSECDPSIVEMARKKEIKLSIDFKKGLKVNVDSKMLRSIFRNLVSNALKFTAPGGSVFIAAQRLKTGGVQFSVRDNGIGMDKARIDKLFRIDTNVNRPGTNGEPSSGLGLLICKDFVERHGGKIWAESEEGKGSTFYFTIK